MKVLLIGHSRIARRRVLPALRTLPEATAITVASRSAVRTDIDSAIPIINDYETAIASSGADLAYVSVANSEHVVWAERCLRAGMHVIVDKPACLTYDEAQRLADVAAAHRCCLAEATVFNYHPQFQALRQAFEDAETRVTRVTTVFSFPPFDPQDFRNRRELGGGALYDLGPYAVATSRLLFGKAPRTIACEVHARQEPAGLDAAFSVLFTYDSGGAMVGHFGFDTEYQNRLHALGPGLSVELQRAFTLPSDTPGRLTMRRNNIESELEIAPSDAFANFLRSVVDAIAIGSWGSFTSAFMADAELLAELRNTSGER